MQTHSSASSSSNLTSRRPLSQPTFQSASRSSNPWPWSGATSGLSPINTTFSDPIIEPNLVLDPFQKPHLPKVPASTTIRTLKTQHWGRNRQISHMEIRDPRILSSYENCIRIPVWAKAITLEFEKFKLHNSLIMTFFNAQHLVPMRWLFSTKTEGTFKARLVGRGISCYRGSTSFRKKSTVMRPRLYQST